jgi:hypothetical protein
MERAMGRFSRLTAAGAEGSLRGRRALLALLGLLALCAPATARAAGAITGVKIPPITLPRGGKLLGTPGTPTLRQLKEGTHPKAIPAPRRSPLATQPSRTTTAPRASPTPAQPVVPTKIVPTTSTGLTHPPSYGGTLLGRGTKAATRTHHASKGISGAAIVIAALGALLLAACAAWALARRRAYEPHWWLSLQHSMAEAGFRSSATWAELRDWARLGR